MHGAWQSRMEVIDIREIPYGNYQVVCILLRQLYSSSEDFRPQIVSRQRIASYMACFGEMYYILFR